MFKFFVYNAESVKLCNSTIAHTEGTLYHLVRYRLKAHSV